MELVFSIALGLWLFYYGPVAVVGAVFLLTLIPRIVWLGLGGCLAFFFLFAIQVGF